MAYKRKTWKNDSSTPLNAAGLNDFEGRIETSFSEMLSYGKNTNGNWVRFKDGTQICYLDLTTIDKVDVPLGSLYRSSLKEWVFPNSFVNVSYANAVISRSDWFTDIKSRYISNTAFTYVITSPTQESQEKEIKRHLFAIGRWK